MTSHTKEVGLTSVEFDQLQRGHSVHYFTSSPHSAVSNKDIVQCLPPPDSDYEPLKAVVENVQNYGTHCKVTLRGYAPPAAKTGRVYPLAGLDKHDQAAISALLVQLIASRLTSLNAERAANGEGPLREGPAHIEAEDCMWECFAVARAAVLSAAAFIRGETHQPKE